MEKTFGKSAFFEFEQRVLAEGSCGAYLPASFFSTEEETRVSYDDRGYEPLRDFVFKSDTEILDFTEKLCMALTEAESSLARPERASISFETVFIRTKEREPSKRSERTVRSIAELRFAFCPEEGEGEASEAAEKVKALLISLLSANTEIDGFAVLKRLAELAGRRGTSVSDLAEKAREGRRDILLNIA